jgi:hypothetical protein
LPTGELMAVDLDRSKWTSVNKFMSHLSFCSLCAIGIDTLQQLQEAYEDGSLGLTLQHSLTYDPLRLVFPDSERDVVTGRLEVLLESCLPRCFQDWGSNSVIIK